MKKYRKKDLSLLFISLLILASSSGLLYYCYDAYKSNKITKELKTMAPVKNEKTINEFVNPPKDKNDLTYQFINEDFYQVDLTNVIKENPDTVGWIYINENINYPIVQSHDNNYYLDHSFTKEKSPAGWIYLDYRNDLNNLSKNTIIYGHNRQDNSMFGTLKNLLKEETYTDKNNYLIKISTPKYNTIWQIFSVYIWLNETYYLTTNFLSEESFSNYVQTIKKRSMIDFPTSINNQDKVLTLSTCKNNNGERIVIHAKLIKRATN